MGAFINGLSAVSPQMTFSGQILLQDPINYRGTSYLKCIEPPVIEFIDPMISRRMSRIIKLGVCSALQCLNNAGIKNPDGIITGTGLGCIEDTEKFLRTLHTNEERLLNPTPFIQSTHNTVSSTIAIMLKCNNYNSTYVHRGNSFESALTDAVMLLHENSAGTILTGGIDELTTDSFNITRRLGFWKKEPVDSLDLLYSKTRGTLAGEGMIFFALSNSRNEKTAAKTEMPEIFYKPENFAETEERIRSYVERSVGDIRNLDLIIMGLNGDIHLDEVYNYLKSKLFAGVPCAYYKHLCGEYDTSSAFAMFMASEIIKEQNVPSVMRLDNNKPEKIRHVLIYNHLRNVNHSMILLSSC